MLPGHIWLAASRHSVGYVLALSCVEASVAGFFSDCAAPVWWGGTHVQVAVLLAAFIVAVGAAQPLEALQYCLYPLFIVALFLFRHQL